MMTEVRMNTNEDLKLMYTSPQLNKNYVNWALKLHILLEIQGIWSIINGEEKEPSESAMPAEIRNWLRAAPNIIKKLKQICRSTSQTWFKFF